MRLEIQPLVRTSNDERLRKASMVLKEGCHCPKPLFRFEQTCGFCLLSVHSIDIDFIRHEEAIGHHIFDKAAFDEAFVPLDIVPFSQCCVETKDESPFR